MRSGFEASALWERRKGYVAAVLAFSLAANVLLLVSPIYMLQIYDRVLTTGSYDVLIWLTIVCCALLAVYAAAEVGRRRVLALAGANFGDQVSAKVYQRFGTSTRPPKLSHDLQLVSRIQGVLQSGMPTALFDLPFVPLFVFLLFVLHPILGYVGVFGALVILSLAVISEIRSRTTGRTALAEDNRSKQFSRGLERQRSAMISMGITRRAFQHWRSLDLNARKLATSASTSDGGYAGLSKSVRQVLQLAILGLGAALALNQSVSAGAVVACSILMGRALAPLDQIVGSWRQLVKARSAWTELKSAVSDTPEMENAISLPKPKACLQISRLTVHIPGQKVELVKSFSLDIHAGEVVALVGANGTGKSTFLQIVSGAMQPSVGLVQLGGKDIHNWEIEDRGQWLGYLPQHVELLPTDVKSNIARLNETEPERVFEATQLIGCHETILKLPSGYETPVGDGGVPISAGQAQSIGLARAVFNRPPAVFLDEPTSNLDHVSSLRLARGLESISKQGSFAIISTHDPRILNIATRILMIQDRAMLSMAADDYIKSQMMNSGKKVG